MTYAGLKRFYCAQFVVYPLALTLLAICSYKLLGTFVPAFIVGGLCCVLFLFVTVRLILWRCPNCGRHFRGDIFMLPRGLGKQDTCVHCHQDVNGTTPAGSIPSQKR